MIGKPEWFTYRKFGWGIAPRTWEGYVYIIVVIAVMGGIMGAGKVLDLQAIIVAGMFSLVVFLIIVDALHIMTLLPKVHDERENYHQLIIERNSSFAAVGAIGALIIFQGTSFALENGTGTQGAFPFDWKLGFVLALMVLVKSGTSFYLKFKA